MPRPRRAAATRSTSTSRPDGQIAPFSPLVDSDQRQSLAVPVDHVPVQGVVGEVRPAADEPAKAGRIRLEDTVPAAEPRERFRGAAPERFGVGGSLGQPALDRRRKAMRVSHGDPPIDPTRRPGPILLAVSAIQACGWQQPNERPMIGAQPPLGARERAGLPNSAFAYIDSQGRRMLPIHDEAHVRNALARFSRVSFEDDAARDRARGCAS